MVQNFFSLCLAFLAGSTAVLASAPTLAKKLQLLPNALELNAAFSYAIPGYNLMPHHQRTPFAVAPNGNAYVAWVANSGNIHVTPLNSRLKRAGSDINVNGYEASGLVAQNDGFALLTRRNGSTTNGETIAVVVRVKNGKEAWATPLNGPAREVASGFASSSPVLDGDLTWNGEYYGAYFIVHGYSGWPAGHYGDSIQYVNDDGTLYVGPYANYWGCSHNEGIAIHQTKEMPFLTLCSNDWHTGIFLNTDTLSMSGPKISNDMTWAGYGGEPFGGEGGSYSNIAALANGQYLVAFQSRGASMLKKDTGDSTVIDVTARWNVHNVVVAPLVNKSTPVTTVPQTPGAAGDSNVNFITRDSNVDHVNVRIAPYGKNHAVVTWEEVTKPTCNAGTCTGDFTGTYFQLVDSNGHSVGSPIVTKATVGGDMRVMANGDVVWPYVQTTWDLSAPVGTAGTTTKLSFGRLRSA